MMISLILKYLTVSKHQSQYMVAYTGSLAPVDFSDAVFNHVNFQKITQISSLCSFYYISDKIPSLLVTIDLSAADLVCLTDQPTNGTAKRKLERLQFSTSSSFVKI